MPDEEAILNFDYDVQTRTPSLHERFDAILQWSRTRSSQRPEECAIVYIDLWQLCRPRWGREGE